MSATPNTGVRADVQEANKATATRFIHGFNDDDWDTVREVVAPGFVFHHPLGGTVEAGPEGMVSTWAGFKVLSPDSWHPIPVMIADGDYVAVLLPTFGTFTGQGEHAPPPTGGRLDYGMVNMVRLEGGQLAEMWFGMDSLVEMQQMGVAPAPPPPALSPQAKANLAAFDRAAVAAGTALDTTAAFDDVVVAMGPPQVDKTTTARVIEIFAFGDDSPTLTYRHELRTDPPYEGDPEVDGEASRAVIERWIDEVLDGHDRSLIDTLVTPHLLIHPTAMPCEATYHGAPGATRWLEGQWSGFGGLTLVDHFSVAHRDIVAVRWTARGISRGEFMGLSPTGDTVEFTGVTMYRLEDGRIAEIWDTRNTLGILHQLNPDLGAGGHHH
jgi:predicted ester cyclase